MKKFAFIIMAMLVAFAFTACNDGQKSKEQQQLDSLMQANSMTQKELAEYVSLVNSISESLDYIQSAENEIYKAKEGSASDRKAAVREKIQNLSNVVNEQREKIAELERKVKSAGANGAKLQALINTLKVEIEQKDALIGDLQRQVESQNFDIANLKENVSVLTASNEELTTNLSEKEEVINAQTEKMNAQTEKMNEAFVKVGTSKELKNAGVLEKSRLNASNLAAAGFKKVDIRNFTELTVPSKKIEILTQMPKNSYVATVEGNSTKIKIYNPESFWSVSKYLIVLVK